MDGKTHNSIIILVLFLVLGIAGYFAVRGVSIQRRATTTGFGIQEIQNDRLFLKGMVTRLPQDDTVTAQLFITKDIMLNLLGIMNVLIGIFLIPVALFMIQMLHPELPHNHRKNKGLFKK